MQPDWDLARALLGGTRSMRAAGSTYLPKWPNEEEKDYRHRLALAVLFPAYKRTISTLAAKPFSKPVTVGEDVPKEFEPYLEDVDMEGRNLDAFAADLMQCGLGYGLCGILVDFPDATAVQATAAGVRTQAAERAAGLRPYWVHIQPWQILGWRADRKNGEWTLQQLRLMECVDEPDGEWGVVKVDQVRVLEPGKWATYRRDPNHKDVWLPHKDGATTIDVVPFVPVYGERVGFMLGRPPLIEVAQLNVAHWQSASDQQNILHVARVPILTVTGVTDGIGPNGESVPWTFTVGASAAVKLPMDADMKFVEHSGKAIEAGVKDLDTLEDRMRQAGAELLVLGPGASTRIEAASENEVGTCALQRITLALEDAIDEALELTARWLNMGEGIGGHVSLFRDFGALTLQEASTKILLDANLQGKLSDETLYYELQRRGIVSPEKSWVDEKGLLDAQGPPLGTVRTTQSGPEPGAPTPAPIAPAPKPAPALTGA